MHPRNNIRATLLIALTGLVTNFACADTDSRTRLAFDASEKSYLIEEMHRNLGAVQTILGALAQKDTTRAKEAALARGTQAYVDRATIRPPNLLKKLPDDFKKLGAAQRKAFDDLAAAIANGEAPDQSIQRVSALMSNCMACHATFRFLD